jgi:hypothetical protein
LKNIIYNKSQSNSPVMVIVVLSVEVDVIESVVAATLKKRV